MARSATGKPFSKGLTRLVGGSNKRSVQPVTPGLKNLGSGGSRSSVDTPHKGKASA